MSVDVSIVSQPVLAPIERLKQLKQSRHCVTSR
jgi:hypothetical protein